MNMCKIYQYLTCVLLLMVSSNCSSYVYVIEAQPSHFGTSINLMNCAALTLDLLSNPKFAKWNEKYHVGPVVVAFVMLLWAHSLCQNKIQKTEENEENTNISDESPDQHSDIPKAILSGLSTSALLTLAAMISAYATFWSCSIGKNIYSFFFPNARENAQTALSNQHFDMFMEKIDAQCDARNCKELIACGNQQRVNKHYLLSSRCVDYLLKAAAFGGEAWVEEEMLQFEQCKAASS